MPIATSSQVGQHGRIDAAFAADATKVPALAKAWCKAQTVVHLEKGQQIVGQVTDVRIHSEDLLFTVTLLNGSQQAWPVKRVAAGLHAAQILNSRSESNEGNTVDATDVIQQLATTLQQQAAPPNARLTDTDFSVEQRKILARLDNMSGSRNATSYVALAQGETRVLMRVVRKIVASPKSL